MSVRRFGSLTNVSAWVGAGVLFALSASACSLLLQTDDKQMRDERRLSQAWHRLRERRLRGEHVPVELGGEVDAGVDASSPLSGASGSVKAPPDAPESGQHQSITMSFFDPGYLPDDAPRRSRRCKRAGTSTSHARIRSPQVVTTSDAQGDATLRSPGRIRRLSCRSTGRRPSPALWYFDPSPVKDGTFNVGLLSPESFQAIATTEGTTIDPDAGHAFNFALDCTATYGTFVAGMSFGTKNVTTETRGFYLVNGLPNTAATATDTSGIGGFANLPTGRRDDHGDGRFELAAFGLGERPDSSGSDHVLADRAVAVAAAHTPAHRTERG